MARSLYSDNLPEFNGKLSLILEEDLEQLTTYLNKRKKIKVFEWDKNKVAISLLLNIDLPSRGNYEGVDIRDEENVLIVFSKSLYPDSAPLVYSDRKSFPKEDISHLYVSGNNEPAPFCLVRGNINEWYANKRIIDIVVRVKNWLRDAANGSLVENGDQFDPMRLNGYRGTTAYKYSQLSKIVEEKRSFEGNSTFAVLLIKEKQKENMEGDNVNFPGFEIIKEVPTIKICKESSKYIFKKLTQIESGINAQRLLLGAVVWNKDGFVNNEFPKGLPKDLNSLIDFAKWAKIDLSELYHFVKFLKFPFIEQIPIIFAVKRPKPLIGYNGYYEFFNFYLTVKDDSFDEEGNLIKNVRVGFQKHNELLSIQKAQEVSGSEDEIGNLICFGCGAIGSKVITHFIREGYAGKNMILCDHDKVEPHNMVRYGLLSKSIGVNKAIALQKMAEELYESDKENLRIIGLPVSGNFLFRSDQLKKSMKNADWVLDFTASGAFENYFIKQEVETSNKVARGFITDEGSVGMLLIEGMKRNPRIDDLNIISQSDYLNNSKISAWLKREYLNSQKETTLINVGVGCNSETTIISDDTISIHSSSFSKAIKAESKIDNKGNGIVYLTYLDSNIGYSIQSERRIIQPLTILKCKNGWEVRMKNGLDKLLFSEMKKASPMETGGVLIGLVNNRTKCIHVTDIILAPDDSEANPTYFVRGTNHLKDQIDLHKDKSGQTFGYIGEWHSHPQGPNKPSMKDLKTIKKFKEAYKKEKIDIPVFVLIVAPRKLIPCLY